MASEGPKVGIKKPAAKVKRKYISKYSSCEEPDHLSYSYSCLESFKKNQHIIRELVSLRKDQGFDKLPDESMLFYQSEDNTQPPIHQYSYVSEESNISEVNNYKLGHKESKPKVNLNPSSKYSKIDLEPDFKDIVDKDLLYKWLKYQFKCVNSLWPFSNPRNSIFSKFANKNRTMKMEVFLSNVDEKTKNRLKGYVNNLELSLEERCTLCNDSLIEIDITPIISDSTRMQEFLTFIHSIESNATRATVDDTLFEKKQIQFFQNPSVQEGCLNKQNDNKVKKNFDKNVFRTNKKSHKIKSPNPDSLSLECLYFSKGSGDAAESEKSVRNEIKSNEVLNNTQTYSCGKEKKKRYSLKINPTTKKRSVITVKSYSSVITNSKIKPNNTSNVVQKPKLTSTFRAKRQTHRNYDDNKMVTAHTLRPNQDNVQNCVQLENKFSCKCLMHLQREDYTRFKNQCLFGEGESTLRKYVSMMEKKSKLKVNQFHNSSHKYMKDNGEESNNETSSSQEAFVVKNKSKTNRHEQIERIDSNTTLSSSTKHESSYIHKTIVKNDYQSNIMKTPVKYHRSSRIISKVQESYQNKVSRTVSNNKNKKTIQYNPTEEMKTPSKTLFLNNYDYRVIHIKDVEELLCEVSYSDTSCCKSSSSNTNSSSKSSDASCTDKTDMFLDQESINACFESLNFSINSIPEGCVSDTFKIKSNGQVKPKDSNTNNRFLQIENTPSKKDSGLVSSLTNSKNYETNKEVLEDRNQNVQVLTDKNRILKAEYCGENLDDVKVSQKREKNVKRKRTSHSMKVRRRSFLESEREQKSMGENSKNLHVKADGVLSEDDSKVLSKICVLENNTRELQSKITELVEQLQLNAKQKELDNTNKQNNDRNKTVKNRPKRANKTMLAINIDDGVEQPKITSNVHKSNKKYFNFIKPQKIYNSISTIFKRSVENNNLSKDTKVEKILNNNKSSKSNSHERTSLEKECQCKTIDLDFGHTTPLVLSSKCAHLNKEDEYFIILSNLEKLNTELRHQNNEIKSLKEYLCNVKK